MVFFSYISMDTNIALYKAKLAEMASKLDVDSASGLAKLTQIQNEIRALSEAQQRLESAKRAAQERFVIEAGGAA